MFCPSSTSWSSTPRRWPGAGRPPRPSRDRPPTERRRENRPHGRRPACRAGRRVPAGGPSAHHGCPPRGPPLAAAPRPGGLRDGGHVPVRQPNAVRRRRGSRLLPARRGPRRAPGRGRGRRPALRPARAGGVPPGFATFVEVSGITGVLEGDPSSRGPGHFRGVATVVAKLLGMVGPDIAYFGQKDAQQALVIRRVVRDLDLPVHVEVLPTVREPDGLAMSSRNAYLGAEDRERAGALSRALRAAELEVAGGERDVDAVLAAARAELDRAGVEPEYLELRHADDLSPVEGVDGPTLLAVAAQVGPARLIDNVVLDARETAARELLVTSTPGDRTRAPDEGS
ncbi:MAG: pantoate--beta-alanine ligase [Thermoleophilaceae bacterium]